MDMRKEVSDNYKPAVFWSFNDVLEDEELDKQLENLLKAGCTGGFMHSRVGLVTEYMSAEWMRVIRHCCEQAEAKSTFLWLYDEDRFPSGYAGGAVLEANDTLRAKALCLIEFDELEKFDVIKIYKSVSRQDKDYVIALCSAKDGNPNFEGKCYVDLLNPETTREFIRQTHEKYRESIGKYFGKQIKGIFSDEFCYTQKASFPCFSVPFTINLEQEFEKQYNYSLTDCLELLFFDEKGYHEVRRDFYEFLTKRFIDSFTKPYNEWCEKHNLIFTGHLLHEDFLTTQPEWTGAVMPHYVHMGMPGIDKLGSDLNYLLTVKQLTSVAEQFGKRSLCEAFGCSGHQFGPAEIKRVADWLCVLGINFINPHLTLYSVRGERKRDYPPDFSWRQPWFEVAEGCFDHISRVCELMDAGKAQPDVLVIHPVQSVWAEYSPLHKPNPVFSIWAPKNENAGQNFITETERFQKPFLDLSNQLLEAGWSFHYGDEMLMQEHGTYDDGIVVGECKYKKVIVPPVSVLRDETIKLLCEVALQYGKDAVIFIGDFPNCIPREKKHLFTVVGNVGAALQKLGKEEKRAVQLWDILSGQLPDKVFYRVCEDESGKKNVFVVNTSKERNYDIKATLPFFCRPAVLDTVTGRYCKVPGQLSDNGFETEIHLKVGGSVMFVSEESEKLEAADTLQSGVTFPKKRKRVDTIAHPTCMVCDANILPLNVVDYRAAGREYLQRPVENIWYTAFYNLENGTPFEAEYRFRVAKLPEQPITALIEMARNLDEIWVNDKLVAVTEEKSMQKYFDHCYDGVMLENLRLGENTIRIRGKKCSNITGIGSHRRVTMGMEHPATELETIFLCGDFGVASVDNGMYEIVQSKKEVTGLMKNAMHPFYAGRLSYKLNLAREIDMISIDAKAQAVALRVDGEIKQLSYLHPFVFEVTNEEGEVEIVLYNALENTYGPLHLAERDKLSMIGPVYFPDMKRYVKEPVLFDYGLYNITLFQKN